MLGATRRLLLLRSGSLPNSLMQQKLLPLSQFLPSVRNLSSTSLTEEQQEMMNSEREHMDFDVLVVGAGPAGLAAAIKVKQMGQIHGTDLSVCVVEKGEQ